MNPVRKIGFSLGIIALLLCLLACFYYLAFTPSGRCHWVAYTGFREAKPRLYLSPQIPNTLDPQIVMMMELAEERVRNFWGVQQSKPFVIFCANESEFARYSRRQNVPAVVHLTIFGAYVILKPDGGNIDVMSHEIGHAELLARLGWEIKTRQVPAWFDEGLALMLDYRYPQASPDYHYQRWRERVWQNFKPEQTFVPLDSLRNIQHFFGKGQFHTYRAYLSAGREVGRWLDLVGKEGLFTLINRLKAGENFMHAYKMIEAKATK